MPLWSKSQEKRALEPAFERTPEPPDNLNSQDSESSDANLAANNASTPQDNSTASPPSEPTWGSRFNSAKQLYGTANQVYNVAQAIPQARTALEPYLAKASTTEDSDLDTRIDLEVEPTRSNQDTPESLTEPKKETTSHESAPYAAKIASSSEATPQRFDKIEVQDDTTGPRQEPSPEGENGQKETAARITPPSPDAQPSESVPESVIKNEAPAEPYNPSESASAEVEPATNDIELRATQAQPREVKTARESPFTDIATKDIAPQGGVDSNDTTSVHSENTAEVEAPGEPDKGTDYVKGKMVETVSFEKTPLGDAAPKDSSAHRDLSAVHSASEVGNEAPKTLRRGLVFARERAVDDTSDEEAAQSNNAFPGEATAKSLDLTDDLHSKPDVVPALDRQRKHSPVSNPVSQPASDSTDGAAALRISPAPHIASNPASENLSATKTLPDPTPIDDASSKPIKVASVADKTSTPSSAEAQPAPATTLQPTSEEIQKAADAAKAAARLQSTADTLWDQARAIRDPAERERLWRAAYNKEVEAHGQSKKARAMASGWGQGVLSGVGLSAAVGVGLGNVVGALLGGVVSVPGSLIGAGVGAALGPLVKLGGYGDKIENTEEKEKPREYEWEEDLSDDEEHQHIVDAVRKAEATVNTKAEDRLQTI